MHKIKLQGEIDSWGYARYLLEYDLRQVPEGEPVELVVDSLGGDVMEAITISNMLKERGNITAHIVGFVASAATWVVYGCDKVVINEDCAYLIHKCSSLIDAWGMMNADELDALIEKLKSEKKSNEAIDLIIAQKYVKHSAGKLDIKGALKLMKEERWMLPEEALSLGLVDEVAEEHVLQKTNYAARLHVMNSMSSLPPLPEKFAAMREENDDKKSFKQRVKEVLTEFFGGSVAMVQRTADVGEVLPSIEETKSEVKMNTTYEFLNKFLEREGLEEQEGKVILNADDLQKLNDYLHTAEGLKDTVNTLTTERDEARQALAAAETAINSISDEIAAMGTIDAKTSAIKATLDKATNVSTTHSQDEGNGHKEESIAIDPVNQIVASYKR